MTLEHEAFHAEVCSAFIQAIDSNLTSYFQTLLYMLLQRAGTGTIPPEGFIPPNWDVLAESWDAAAKPSSSSVVLGPTNITMGHDDAEEDDASTDVAGHEFGWDNEHPKREIEVEAFRIDWRPIANGEFYEFYNSGGKDMKDVTYPASWVKVDGETQVLRSLFE